MGLRFVVIEKFLASVWDDVDDGEEDDWEWEWELKKYINSVHEYAIQ